MFEEIPINQSNIYAFRASGKLTDDDYKALIPKLEKLISNTDKLSLYIELEDFDGWEPLAAWDDLRFGVKHDKDFSRVAIIGDKRWESPAIVLTNLLFHTKIRYFHKGDEQAALDWLNDAIKKEQMREYNRILVGVDYSDCSERAVRRAIDLTNEYNSDLQVIHVIDDIGFYTDIYGPVLSDIQEQKAFMEKHANAQLDVLAKRLELDSTVELKVQWGTPKNTLLSIIETDDIDLVVLGSHGRRGIKRLLGSVSSGVLNLATCDVLVVR